ncbi:MAG: DUF362 domain-containing protein [Bacillota bacterium]
MEKVYFSNLNGAPEDGVLEKLRRLCLAAGLDGFVREGELTAVKLHFGELGNTRMLRPQFVSVPVSIIKGKGAVPFLTDCNTLFMRRRYHAPAHLETARFNGFDAAVTGAPLVIADGLRGLDYRVVKSGGDLGEVKVGAAIYEADKLVVLTHFKGHEDTGFGGILKNLGVGAVARPGKLKLHTRRKPVIDQQLCTGCGLCLQQCLRGAVLQRDDGYFIDQERCTSCGDCLVSCPQRAIPLCFDLEGVELQKRLVEACAVVLANKQGRAFYVSFLMDVTPYCDCRSWSPAPLVSDLGMLAGRDPLAVEQASFDLVETAITRAYPGKRLADFTGVEGAHQLVFAEEAGLGSRGYALVEV